MKKALALVLLLSGLLLYGCGMGGGTTETSGGGNATSNPGGGNEPGNEPQLASPQLFTLNIVDADKLRVSRATTFLDEGAYPSPTNARVVTRLFSSVTTTTIQCEYNYDSEGYPIEPHNCIPVGNTKLTEIYKDIQDYDYTTGSLTVRIPAHDDYTIDVITSTGTPTHQILKYGQATNVDVGSSATGTVYISNVANRLNMSVTDSILSSTETHSFSFDVTVTDFTIKEGMPFAPSYSMLMTWGTSSVTAYSVSNTCTLKAPISTNESQVTEVSLKGTFTLDDVFLKPTDSRALWIRQFPNFAGENVYTNLSPLVPVIILQ